ncbi:MAG: hypothetical protein IJV40_02535 [Oscillospiraceae bacterium]|nr:hypothetical protein [Oscillospiraceae bacterium]
MKKIKSFSRSPMGTMLMFMLAVLLLMTGTIGGVRAAPQIFNPDFAYSGVELDQIGITLRENGKDISSRDYDRETESFSTKQGVLLQNLLGTDEELKIGKSYNEALSVYNSGSIPEYVRVTVYKYWIDKNGNRFDAYNTAGEDILNKLIELNFLETNGWKIDHNADTKERTVLYYQNVLNSRSETPAFTDTLKINKDVIDYATVTTTTSGSTVTWVADGLTFQIEAEADGVQNHNARAAVKSAWGLTDADIARLGLNLG